MHHDRWCMHHGVLTLQNHEKHTDIPLLFLLLLRCSSTSRSTLVQHVQVDVHWTGARAQRPKTGSVYPVRDWYVPDTPPPGGLRPQRSVWRGDQSIQNTQTSKNFSPNRTEHTSVFAAMFCTATRRTSSSTTCGEGTKAPEHPNRRRTPEEIP